RAGFTAEGLHLALPDLGPGTLPLLGPRLAPETVHRLRRLVCPTTAAAVMLGLATDVEAGWLSLYRPAVPAQPIPPVRRGRHQQHHHYRPDTSTDAPSASRCQIPRAAAKYLASTVERRS